MLHLKTKDKTMKTGLLGASAALVIFVGGAAQAGYEQPVRPGGVNGW